jgi:threonine synthase
MSEIFHAGLRCMDCSSVYPIDAVLFRCPSCGGLLDVYHDRNLLRAIPAPEWKQRFEQRFRSAQYPYSSGVWGKKEWVLPAIKDENIISLGEGATPLVPVPGLAELYGLSELWVKQCGISHTGSFKDLGMTVLVSHVNDLIRAGRPIRAVACASTGDTSAALAAYGARAGIPVIIFLPEGKITTAQLVQPLASGAAVIQLKTDFDGCMKVVRELTADAEAGIYLANSMNPLRIEGQKTVGIEVIQQLAWQVPDWFVIPGGNLGNVSALGAGFDLLLEMGLITKAPRICVAQAAHANPLYLSYQNGFRDFQPVTAKKTLASAIQIGAPVSFHRAVRALKRFNGVVEEASEEELADAAARGDRVGLFNDPHTGVALACTEKLIARGVIEKEQKVVVISTAHGLKFSEFKTGYHNGTLEGVRSNYANRPVSCEPDVDAVKRILDRMPASV